MLTWNHHNNYVYSSYIIIKRLLSITGIFRQSRRIWYTAYIVHQYVFVLRNVSWVVALRSTVQVMILVILPVHSYELYLHAFTHGYTLTPWNVSHFSILFPTFHHFFLLFGTFHHFQPLFPIFRHYSPLFPIFRQFSPLLATFPHFSLLLTNFCHFPSLLATFSHFSTLSTNFSNF